MQAEWQKIEFLKTMRSICRVKPDEKSMFSQTLFGPPLPIVGQRKIKAYLGERKVLKEGFGRSN